MKFANKYELFEAVTSGRVETFFAKDLASGERVLLHIFDAPEKKPDQPTVLWVLESFRKVAPDPPGLVVETGRYSGTTYAYLVTKLPDNEVLQRWTESYESHVRETQEMPIPSAPTIPGSSATGKDRSQPENRPAEESTPARSASPHGEFTAAFLGLASPPSPQKTGRDEINLGPEPAAPRQEPGDFTRQFFSASHETPQKPATQAPAKLPEASAHPNREVPRIGVESQVAAKPESPEPPTPAPGGGRTANSVSSPDPGSFTALFRSDFKSETKATAESVGAPRKLDDAKSGDFTDFFRGPFDGERPAETPNILPKDLDTPQRDAPGDFTRVFGPAKSGALAATPPLKGPARDTPLEDSPGTFTQGFPDARQPAPPSPSPTWEPRAPKSEIPPPSLEPAWTPPAPLSAKAPLAPSIEAIFPGPPVSSTLREAEPALPNGATRVFSTPAGRLVASPPPLPAGPSEYTRIISGGMRGPAEEAPIAGGSQTPSGGPPAFKLPPPPAVPPAPKFAAPPPPKFSPPAAPKVPQLEIKAPKPKAAYLPLVIILNVLLFFAILLIVYFSIKH